MPLKSILRRGWVARATAKMWPNDPQSVVRIYPTMLFTGCTSFQEKACFFHKDLKSLGNQI